MKLIDADELIDFLQSRPWSQNTARFVDVIVGTLEKWPVIEWPVIKSETKWTPCSQKLPDEEVICCDIDNNIMLGYVFVDIKSDSGFSAENDNCYMYECVAWMPKPKGYMEVNDAE